MFVEPADYRPPSLMVIRPPSPLGVAGGFAALITVYGGMALLALIFTTATGRSVLDQHAIGEEPEVAAPTEPEIVEAGFVQLGRAWDPRELPDRRIQSNAQAPRAQDPNVVSPFQRILADAGVRPENRALSALLDTTASYDQEGTANFLYEQEGEAWGAQNAREGDMLIGQLVSLVRRGTSVPPNLPESEFRSTVAVVTIIVDANWTVSSAQFTRSSGNDDWDLVVRRRVAEIADARPHLQPQTGSETRLGVPITIRVYPIAARRRSGGASPSSMNALESLGAGY